jgi:antibiotic biosynthesis monooxygenase (ABM) superfamily enzyme
MSKRFTDLDELQAWLQSPERGDYEIEYIVREGTRYLVLFHPLPKAA